MPKIRIGLQIESTSPSIRQLIGSGKGVSEWDGIDPDEIVKVTHTVKSSDIQEINPGIYYNVPSITTAKQGDTLFSDDGRLFVYDEDGSRWFLWYTFDNSSAKIHTNNTLKGEGTLDDPLTVNATVVALKGDLNPLLEATDNGDDTYTFTSFDGNTSFTIAIPLLSIGAGTGIEIDVTDPKRPQVRLNQATQDILNTSTLNTDQDVSGNDWVLDEDDMVSDSDEKVPTQQSVKAYVDAFHEYLVIDQNQIFSKRGANEIEFPNKDIILSADSTQPNKILGTSALRNIIGGYDNTINDNIASSIFGSHHSTIAGGGHNLIAGGSTNTINGSSYSAIVGGRNMTIHGVNIRFLGGCENGEIHGAGGFGAICARDVVIDPAYTGTYAFIGPSSRSKIESTAGNHNSIVGGLDNVLAGAYGFIGQGSNNRVSGIRGSVINGIQNTASGDDSIVLNGRVNTAYSFGEVVCGLYATEYIPNNPTGYDSNDRIFAIGVGPNSNNRRNAYTAWKSGRNQFRFINIENYTPSTAVKQDGDIWFNGTDLKIRIGGADKTFTLT